MKIKTVKRHSGRIVNALEKSRGLVVVKAAHPVNAYAQKNYSACQYRLVPAGSVGQYTAKADRVAWYNSTGSQIDYVRAVAHFLESVQ